MPSRRFELVPFGGRTTDDAVSCDGLVSGAGFDLSHWAGNVTPADYKADTSTESALLYGERPADRPARVVNNHFDTDGVLAVWALLDTERALSHAGLLTAAAEVGDFDEWPEDERGLWLDAAVSRLAEGCRSDAERYRRVLPELSNVVPRLEQCAALYQDAFGDLCEQHERATRGGALAVEACGAVAILVHARGVAELAGPVLSRCAPPACARWLLAFAQGDGKYTYRYELRRWAWADTVRRPPLKRPSRNALSAGLGAGWAIKGDLGMTGLLRTTEPVRIEPTALAEHLVARDHALRSVV